MTLDGLERSEPKLAGGSLAFEELPEASARHGLSIGGVSGGSGLLDSPSGASSLSK